LPAGPVAVAPGQPEVGSAQAGTPDIDGVRKASPTAGIINALCDVTNEVTLVCDTDGDGVPEATIPLTDITPVNRLLIRATLSPGQLPGTAFPLSCCGGIAVLELVRSVEVEGQRVVIHKLSIDIDLGLRGPVVLSVTPSSADCSVNQNLIMSGSCFVLPDGTPNVTSVFAVEKADPNNVIQAASFSVLSTNLLDADFNFGSENAGKSFLVFAAGPNGRSRNLTSLPPGAPANCPIGNEAGIQVMFTCTAPPQAPNDVAVVTGCLLERTPGGGFLLKITGENIREGATIMINGGSARKVKFREVDPGSGAFRTVEVKGKICKLLPGLIVITNPGEQPSEPFQCNPSCDQ
jgi:hypothetical protein